MAQFKQMLEIQMVIFIYLLIGAICKKNKIITKESQQKLIPFILNGLMPVMTFHSFKAVTLQMMEKAFIVLIIAIVICVVSLMLAKFVYRKYPIDKQKILQYGTLISNAGFAGLPIASQMFGEVGLIYASIYLIPIRIFMWSAGRTILSSESASPKEIMISLLKNPNIVAVLIGLPRGLLQISLPAIVDTAFGNVSSCVTPISLIVIGAVICDVGFKHFFEEGMISYCIMRLGLIPVLTLIITTLCGFDATIIGTTTILASMPAPTTTALLAGQYHLDVNYASKLVFLTTLLSMITCPLLMMFL